MQLKSQLQSIKKGNQSIKDYAAKIKNIVAVLNEVGCFISLQEHIVYILSRLGTEYDAIVSAISAKSKTKPLQEIVSLLMSHESRLKRNSMINIDETQPTANIVSGPDERKQNSQKTYQRNRNQPQWNNQWQNNRGR